MIVVLLSSEKVKTTSWLGFMIETSLDQIRCKLAIWTKSAQLFKTFGFDNFILPVY